MIDARPAEVHVCGSKLPSEESWQVRFSPSILGVMASVRRNSRGDWLNGDKIPEHVRQFLTLKPRPGSAHRWVLDPEQFPNMDAVREIQEIRWQKRAGRMMRPQGIVNIPAPDKPPQPPKVPRNVPAIRSMADLCNHFGADEPRGLNRRMFKDTDCGASISVYLKDGTAIHNGNPQWDTLTRKTPIRGFTIQTIVEGSDAEVNSDEFLVPVSIASVDAWIKDMEAEASRLWDEANTEEAEP